MKANVNTTSQGMVQLFMHKFVPTKDFLAALAMTIATYWFIIGQFPPGNPSFLKDVSQYIALISANLWAIMLAALVIAIPHIDTDKHVGTLSRFSAITFVLVLCMFFSSALYFFAAFRQETTILPVIVLAPIICLFYYAIIMSFVATIQILKDYIKFPTFIKFHVSKKE